MKYKGFTIVELLIVIVVIGILAAITVVAYGTVQQRARNSAALSAVTQAKKKLEVFRVDNGSYPLSGSLSSAGINNSADTDYQYTSDGMTYCLTGTFRDTSYKVSDSTAASSGGCAGHGQGGVAAIKNLVLDPKATGSNWFAPIVSGVTRNMGVTWNGKTNWSRFVWNGSGATTVRLYLNLSDLTDGQAYTSSFLAGNDGTASVTFRMDLADASPVAEYTLAPGEQRRVSFTASQSDYNSTFRFIDMNLLTSGGSGVLITDGIVTEGSGSYTFAHGDSPDWIWNGAANNSTSTGPPL